jgi:hypothetical protein
MSIERRNSGEKSAIDLGVGERIEDQLEAIAAGQSPLEQFVADHVWGPQHLGNSGKPHNDGLFADDSRGKSKPHDVELFGDGRDHQYHEADTQIAARSLTLKGGDRPADVAHNKEIDEEANRVIAESYLDIKDHGRLSEKTIEHWTKLRRDFDPDRTRPRELILNYFTGIAHAIQNKLGGEQANIYPVVQGDPVDPKGPGLFLRLHNSNSGKLEPAVQFWNGY